MNQLNPFRSVMFVIAVVGGLACAAPPAAAQEREGGAPGQAGTDQPQSENDQQALIRIIQELRAEVAELRAEVRELRGERADQPQRERDGDRRPAAGDGDARPQTADTRRRSQNGRIFGAYDKDRDDRVSFDEWCAMREGEVVGERRVREQMQYLSADADRDGALTFEEFDASRSGRASRQEGPLVAAFVAYDETQFTLRVAVEGRSGEGGASIEDGERTFDVDRRPLVTVDGKEGKLSDLKEGDRIGLWLSLDGKKVIGVNDIPKRGR